MPQPAINITQFNGIYLSGDDEESGGQYASDQVNVKSNLPGTLEVRQGVMPVSAEVTSTYS